MENNHRIASMSVTPTLPRQTPKNEFGEVFARTAQEVVKTGVGLIGGMLPGGPVMSAAVSSISSVASSVPSTNASITPLPGTGGVTGGTSGPGATGGTTGRGDAWDMLEAQRLMAQEGQKFNVAYLQLQNEMQRESREHNAISNIMKVRHDSAKAAINNIR
jgi:hypothetical protein